MIEKEEKWIHEGLITESLPNEPRRLSLLQVKASSSEESSPPIDADELFSGLKEKWVAVESKSTVILYAGGAIVAVWLSSVVVGAVNCVPLLPKILELVGLGYTGWFVYRYLLFKQSRKELATDIEALKKKIAGTE
ncbi:protein CURVATURE THYLAKOID 1A, chloroplastic [Actinidia eriantha]|uniref:protein CURVATURE THYLAKOID 1A, chloroplastic n=1 Tax=Actinidia eriantha TaxID=165200 RepID=UPI002584D944|nr:protein CURVATURE THYLAKOID 1A, chloroplastic [Actinidia eriantha]